LWRYLIERHALGRDVPEPDWFGLPALCKLTVTRPDLAKRLKLFPFNFCLVAQVQAFQSSAQGRPVAVTGLTEVSSNSGGGQDSAALVRSGTVMTWGIDQWGTLGDGSTGSPSDVPVTVTGVRKVANMSAGGAHMVAYGEPIPAVSGVSPKLGPTAGGTSVTISGANLTGATIVKFGSAEASNVTVSSSTSVTATAPAGTGTVDITVTTPLGTSAPSPADRFTYVAAPQITKTAPKIGSTVGGTTVTLTGLNFIGVTAVKFGSVQASSFKVDSSTSITAVTPAEPVGVVEISVSTEFGTSAATTSDRYKFAPTITGVSPSGGPVTGGTSVTVTGAGFVAGTTGTKFSFGTTHSASVNCASSTECTVVAPPHEAGTVEITAMVNKVGSLKSPRPTTSPTAEAAKPTKLGPVGLAGS
jgi:IPT/TIG domain/Regulator of chromosome condensation (RCC1) repeat